MKKRPAWAEHASRISTSMNSKEPAYCIVPVRFTDLNTAGAATFTFSVAFIGTLLAHVGLNVTFAVQLAPTAKVAGQLFV